MFLLPCIDLTSNNRTLRNKHTTKESMSINCTTYIGIYIHIYILDIGEYIYIRIYIYMFYYHQVIYNNEMFFSVQFF